MKTTYALELIELNQPLDKMFSILLTNTQNDSQIAEVTFEFAEDSMLCSVIDYNAGIELCPTIMHVPGFIMDILDLHFDEEYLHYYEIFFAVDDGLEVKHRITFTAPSEVTKEGKGKAA